MQECSRKRLRSNQLTQKRTIIVKLDKKYEKNPLYIEIEQLCNELPINKVLEKMLELMNGMPNDMEKRIEVFHYELTKMKKCLDYAQEVAKSK